MHFQMKISQKNRKIGYTYSSVSGNYAFRGEKSIAFESTLERDLLIALEFDSNVLDVIEQPVTIEYVNNNGRQVTYTPDFLVHYRTSSHNDTASKPKSKLIEVKPHKILQDKWLELKPKFKVGTALSKQQGWIFSIYDESRIRNQHFTNIRLINRYRNHEYCRDEKSRIINHINEVRHTSIDHLIDHLSVKQDAKSIVLSHVYHLLSKHVIVCDMGFPISMETVVCLRH